MPTNISSTSVTATNGATTAVSAPVTSASPLADRVTQAVSYVTMAIAILAIDAPALTTAERRRMGKLRRGGDKLIPQIAHIAQAWSVQIRTQPTDSMTTGIGIAPLLQPLVTVLSGFLQEAQDTGYKAQGDAWGTATALYTILKRMSRKDPLLKAQLAPIAAFFAYRRPVPTTPKPKPVGAPPKTARRKAKVLANAKAVVAKATAASAAPVAAAAGSPAAPGALSPHA